jgi:hypothetical protein
MKVSKEIRTLKTYCPEINVFRTVIIFKYCQVIVTRDGVWIGNHIY